LQALHEAALVHADETGQLVLDFGVHDAGPAFPWLRARRRAKWQAERRGGCPCFWNVNGYLWFFKHLLACLIVAVENKNKEELSEE
jgi:hypothetical protein